MQGLPENYVKKIVEISEQRIPDEMHQFRSTHNIRTRNTRDVGRFWSYELGRGIDFLRQVFNWNPLPKYRPGLQLWFHLRNLTVHNNGIADDKLCQLVKNPNVELFGEPKVGDKVSWNIGNALQLPHFIIQILTDADPYIVNKLKLPTLKQRPFWRIDNTLNI